MSDVVVPLTSPVHLTNIEDIHAVDLHVRYCELVKAYEHLVRDRNQEKKSHEQQVSAMRNVMAKETTWRRREIEPKVPKPKVPESELELRYSQMEKRVQVMECSLANERKINKELEADLQTAVNEGIKYRDHLARMLEIREKDERAQQNIKLAQDQDEKTQTTTLASRLEEAEKSVQFERAQALRLQKEIERLEQLAGSSQEENLSLHAQLEALHSRVGEMENEAGCRETADEQVQNLQRKLESEILASSAATAEKTELNRRVQELQCENDDLRRNAADEEARRKSGASQIENEHQRKVEKLEGETEMLNAEIRVLTASEKRLQGRTAELETELEDEKLTRERIANDLKAKDEAYKREIEEVRDQLEIQSHNESTHERDLAEMKRTRERLLAEIEEHQTAIQRDRDSKSQEIRGLQAELDQVSTSCSAEIDTLNEKCREHAKIEAQLRAQIKDLQAELERVNSLYQKAKNETEASASVHLREVSELSDQVEAKRKETQTMRRQMDELLADKDSEQDTLVRASREKDRSLEALASEVESMKHSITGANERESRTRQQMRQIQNDLENERENAAKANRDLQTERENLGREIRDLQDDRQQRQMHEQKLRAEMDELQRARHRLIEQVEELQRDRNKDQEVNADALREQERRLEIQRSEMLSMASQIKDHVKLEESWREEVGLLKKAKDDLQRRCDHQDSELNELQARISKSRNTTDNPARTPTTDRNTGSIRMNTPSVFEASMVPDTPEADPEEWKTAIAQYETAPSNTIVDFVLVNKRASTVNVISIDTILRRHLNSVTRIDISYNYLRNSGVISLAYVFKSLVNLVHLDIGDNHVGDSGAAAIAEATCASKKLQTLALGGNRISDAGLTAISTSMATSLSTLNFNFNCVADEGATSLVSSFPRTLRPWP